MAVVQIVIRQIAKILFPPSVRRKLPGISGRIYWHVLWPIGHRLRLLFGPYSGEDLSELWRSRAVRPGQTGVMWKNDDWNSLYRLEQEKLLGPWVERLPVGSEVLDICCGVGTVCAMIKRINPGVKIDGVDFEEMICLARVNADSGIHYIVSAAEDYIVEKKYDLVVSSGAISVIKNPEKMMRTIQNCTRMIKRGGTFVMIDPWHRWRYLARARYSSGQIIEIMSRLGLVLVQRSGIIFWPFRDCLANSRLTGMKLKRLFDFGEKLLGFLGRNLWSDYKVLIFRKESE